MASISFPNAFVSLVQEDGNGFVTIPTPDRLRMQSSSWFKSFGNDSVWVWGLRNLHFSLAAQALDSLRTTSLERSYQVCSCFGRNMGPKLSLIAVGQSRFERVCFLSNIL